MIGIVPMPVCAPSETENDPLRPYCSASSMDVVLLSPRPPYSVGTSTMSSPASPALRRRSATSPAFFDSISRTRGRISFSKKSRPELASSRSSSVNDSTVTRSACPFSPTGRRNLAAAWTRASETPRLEAVTDGLRNF